MSVSVIIPSYRSDASLARVLTALLPSLGPKTEVLVVHSAELAAAEALQRAHPRIRVIGIAERVLPGKARNLAAREATGSRLAFLDADAVPGPGWLERLESALGGAAGVAGAVRNGTPCSRVGTAAYLLEFSEFSPGRRGMPAHGASCNLLVDRDAFERAGGFCDDLWPGEDTVLTVPWAAAGRLRFASEAPVWHLNRTELPAMCRHQFRLGEAFAEVCDRVEFPHDRFSRWPWLLGGGALRLAALTRRLSSQPPLLREAGRVSPLLGIGLASWTAGLAARRSR